MRNFKFIIFIALLAMLPDIANCENINILNKHFDRQGINEHFSKLKKVVAIPINPKISESVF